jgi:hypothetical protein
VAHVCNPSYLGGWGQEDKGSRPAQANGLRDPTSKTVRVKMDWRCDVQGVDPKIKPQYRKKKKAGQTGIY